jgi:hypothetical protein
MAGAEVRLMTTSLMMFFPQVDVDQDVGQRLSEVSSCLLDAAILLFRSAIRDL